MSQEPKQRLTAANALDHPWFADLGLVDKATLPKLTHGSEMNSKFAHFMGMAKLKKVRISDERSYELGMRRLRL